MEIQEKLYYSIGEVKEITGVETHVLRYWESEFPSFKPRKSRSGQRAYTRKDIDMALKIKGLLYEEKFTIKGAKNKIKEKDTEPVHPRVQKEAPVEKTAKPVSTPSKSMHTRKAGAASRTNQLVFNEIETAADSQLDNSEFLMHLRGELVQVSKTIKDIVTDL